MTIWRKPSKIREKVTFNNKFITKEFDELHKKDKQLKNLHKWTDEQVKELKEKYFYYIEHKKEAEEHFKKRWHLIGLKAHKLKITSMKINKNCSAFLGCHIAERILSHVFKDVERMPNGNIGYDFICNKGYKIDVKSSCLYKDNYSFTIKCNKVPDYFLLIGFNNRIDLNPQHIWLIKRNKVLRNNKKLNEHYGLGIRTSLKYLSKYSEYELTDKLNETIECCNKLKNI